MHTTDTREEKRTTERERKGKRTEKLKSICSYALYDDAMLKRRGAARQAHWQGEKGSTHTHTYIMHTHAHSHSHAAMGDVLQVVVAAAVAVAFGG